MKPYPLFLLVSLAWPALDFAASASQLPAPAPVWQQSQETNVPGAYTYSRFTLLGKFIASPHDVARDRPAIVVDCIPADESPRDRGTLLQGRLIVGTTLKVEYVEPNENLTGIAYYPKVDVRYRTDDAKREQDQWAPGPGKTSTAIPEHSIKQILRAHTVAITAADEQGRKVTMQFDIPDATAVEQSCHVDTH
jgi:hypothetical protein